MRRDRAIELLSLRELQVFILSGRSKTLTEIGIIFNISSRTVSTYRVNILRKMELENIYQIMEYCIRADMDNDEFMNKYI